MAANDNTSPRECDPSFSPKFERMRAEYNWFVRLCDDVVTLSALVVPGPGVFLEQYPTIKGVKQLLRARGGEGNWLDSVSQAVGAVFALVEDPRTPKWAHQLRQLAADLVTAFDQAYLIVAKLANTPERAAKSPQTLTNWRTLRALMDTLSREVQAIRGVADAMSAIGSIFKEHADFEDELIKIGAAEILASGSFRLTGGTKQREFVRVWLDRENGEVYLGRLNPSQADELLKLVQHANEHALAHGEYRGLALYNKKIKAIQTRLPLLAPFITRVKGSTAGAKAYYRAEAPMHRPIVDHRG